MFKIGIAVELTPIVGLHFFFRLSTVIEFNKKLKTYIKNELYDKLENVKKSINGVIYRSIFETVIILIPVFVYFIIKDKVLAFNLVLIVYIFMAANNLLAYFIFKKIHSEVLSEDYIEEKGSLIEIFDSE